MKKRGQTGISIPELMVTIAVAGILSVAAITSYSVFKEKSRVSGGQWLVYNLLMRTRAEAVAQGRTVSTADLLRSPTGSDHEAPSLTAWMQKESGYSGYSVSPDAVAFDGRGLTSGGAGDIEVNVSVGSKSGSVLVSSGGIVKIP
jgi:prepilin-type N-terminal cleavage/methylation domain-containing protein